jgi:hypothetical protein
LWLAKLREVLVSFSSMSLLESVIESIRPVKFSAVRADDEFKALGAILRDPDPDKWDEREKVLRKLAGMAMTHELSDEEFSRQLRLLRTTLQLQVLVHNSIK